jgi:dihydrofolate synthase/folylpolyglutamate synthase
LNVESLGYENECKPLLTSEVQNINHLDAEDSLPGKDNFPATIQLDLTGTYQIKNLATVLSSVKQLRIQGYCITNEHIQTALKQVTSLTGLMGRWQTISKNPLVICDTGHNEDGIKEVIKNIANTSYQNLHMVIGMVKDKDINKVLSLLPANARYYFCEPNIPRAKTAIELQLEAKNYGLIGETYQTIKQALETAKLAALPNDLIFVGGSTFVVAEVV